MAVSRAALTFRKATAADARSVQRLVKSAYRGESSRAGWTTEADLVADERIDEAGVASKISQPNALILVAHDEHGSLVGCCEVEAKSGNIGYFGMFAVDPMRQAGGLGKMILSAAEQMARDELDVRIMEMFVIWRRRELIEWYIRRGYRVTGRTSPFPYAHLINGKALRDDLHFLVLEKDL
ncbi:Acyl-CoA N-acyltransferase [Moelleriella libera RCEF 2490]|uniref:Acyl-CoA N-acyltransferase n=1 Tax=Moelleriella libera RCEF 2490 TaxID=1081109 RepID=A0A167VYI8_9HYPO|nr:Acyl-CoA N-acyltransferase [Moelleriella libera RCEF 2490]